MYENEIVTFISIIIWAQLSSNLKGPLLNDKSNARMVARV